MEQRICYGRNTPVTFRENLQFSTDCPYRIRKKDFQNDDVAPLHYAETLEIGLCCGISGELTIGNERMNISGDMVYAVAPGAVHATSFSRSSGYIYVIQISLEALRPLVDVQLLFTQQGKALGDIPHLCGDFEKMRALVEEMIRLDASPISRTRLLLEIFELLEARTPAAPVAIHSHSIPNQELYRVIQWTEAHFDEPIHLEQPAALVGFSKNYFCAWFHGNTGSTYMQYLNQVRINHACRILVYTGSIESACYDSGFRDMSYFVQTFRKTQGCTPKGYIRNFKQMPNQ